MANRSSKLTLVIAGENKGAVSAVKGTEAAVGGLQGKLGGLAAGIGGAALVAGVERLTQAAVDGYTRAASAVAVTNRLTGVGAKNASLLAFAAQQSGVDATKAAASWGIFATNIKNGKVAAQGIATTDGNGKLLDFNTILDNTADKLASLPPGFQRTAAARAIFGRGGADMVKILANGSAGIEDLRGKMKSLGLEFDEVGLAKYQKFLQSQRDVQAALTGLEVKVGGAVIPVIEKLADTATKGVEVFNSLPGPVQAVTAGVGGLAAAVLGLTTLVGLFGPVLATGRSILAGMIPTLGGAAVATDDLAKSTLLAGEAQDNLTRAWLAGEPAAEKAVLSREALALADTELAGAEVEASSASAGMAASLGPIAIALAAVYGVYKAISGVGKTSISIDDQKALGASNAELVKFAENLKSIDASKFDDINLPVLKAMRDALADSGHKVIPELTTAIDKKEAAEARANKRTKEAATANDSAAQSEDEHTAAIKRNTDALSKHSSNAKGLFDAQQSLRSATDGVVSAEDDLNAARADAAGTSDDAVAKSKAISDARHDEADALDGVTEAQQTARDARAALNEEEAHAKQRIVDLTEATRKATQSQRDATLALHEAQAENAKVLRDPHSTALDREKARVGLQDAQGDLTGATKDHADAVRDETAAKAAGVEGDKQVIAAKKRVADADAGIVDAEQKVNEAHQHVTDAVLARDKFRRDSTDKVREAVEKVNGALYDAVVAHAAVVTAEQGTAAGIVDLRNGLTGLAQDFGVGSPLTANMLQFADDLSAALRGFRLRQSQGGVVVNETGQVLSGPPSPDGTLPGQVGPRGPKSLNASSGEGGSVNVTINQQHLGTPRQVGRASAAAAGKTLDQLFAGTR